MHFVSFRIPRVLKHLFLLFLLRVCSSVFIHLCFRLYRWDESPYCYFNRFYSERCERDCFLSFHLLTRATKRSLLVNEIFELFSPSHLLHLIQNSEYSLSTLNYIYHSVCPAVADLFERVARYYFGLFYLVHQHFNHCCFLILHLLRSKQILWGSFHISRLILWFLRLECIRRATVLCYLFLSLRILLVLGDLTIRRG